MGWREEVMNGPKGDKEKAKKLVEEALKLVGEPGLRDIISQLGCASLTMAVSLLYSDAWWITRLTSAIDSPQSVNIGLLTKLIDKLIPSMSAVKPQTEQPDQLIIQYENPHEEVSQTSTNS